MSEIENYFKKDQASAYDERFEKLSPLKDVVHLAAQLAFQQLPENAHILIVGAGTGAELLHLATHYPGWQFTAVEPSTDMLNICRSKIAKAGWTHRCIFHRGFVDELPSQPVFHGATSLLVSHFLLEADKKRAFFGDIYQRLLPSGCLLTADLTECGQDQEVIWPLWLRAIAYCGADDEQIQNYTQSLDSGVSMLSDSEMKVLLAESGFQKSTLVVRALLINAWFAIRE